MQEACYKRCSEAHERPTRGTPDRQGSWSMVLKSVYSCGGNFLEATYKGLDSPLSPGIGRTANQEQACQRVFNNMRGEPASH